MKKINVIETNSYDDFFYLDLIKLFNQIKITQGGTALDSTLRRHPLLLNYCISKQIAIIRSFEDNYFNSDGTLNYDFILKKYNNLKDNPLQNLSNLVY